MLRHASLLIPLIALLTTSCYLAHRIDDPGDASVTPDAPELSMQACCLTIPCGPEGVSCGDTEECTLFGCAPRCEGPRCGGTCCAGGELCIADECVSPGPPCSSDADCEAPQRCDPVGLRCIPSGTAVCIEPRPFEPVLQWENTVIDMITVPLVLPVDDDDVPDIVALTVPSGGGRALGTLGAFSGDDGRQLWELGNIFMGACSHSTAAAADLDGDGRMEIAILARMSMPHGHYSIDPTDPLPCLVPPFERGECGPFPPDAGPPHVHTGDPRVRHEHTDASCTSFSDDPGALLIVSHRGEVVRDVRLPRFDRREQVGTLLVADLDADGSAEVLAEGSVVGAEGIRWSDARLAGVGVAIGDIDRDGRQELVTARHAFRHDGTLLWAAEDADVTGHPVIADVLRDPVSRGPQVIVADGRTLVVRDGATGEVLLGPLRFSAGISSGPPTVADFDGDGRPEVGIMADHAYVMFDFDLPAPPYIRWSVTCDDRTPGTVGASAFDLDSDGAADVVYSDECHVRILSGRDGGVLWARSNPSVTVWEYPVVADVDGDGEAELVVGSNLRFASSTADARCDERVEPFITAPGGLRIFEDRLHNWVGTRPLWNEHGYHIDNVLDDGSIPVEAPRPWEDHNSVRASPRYPDERDVFLPNLIATAIRVEAATCGDDVTLHARIENRGSRAAEAGARVVFRSGARALGIAATTGVLLPGGSEWVSSRPFHRTLLGEDLRVEMEEESPCGLGEAMVAIVAIDCVPL